MTTFPDFCGNGLVLLYIPKLMYPCLSKNAWILITICLSESQGGSSLDKVVSEHNWSFGFSNHICRILKFNKCYQMDYQLINK